MIDYPFLLLSSKAFCAGETHQNFFCMAMALSIKVIFKCRLLLVYYNFFLCAFPYNRIFNLSQKVEIYPTVSGFNFLMLGNFSYVLLSAFSKSSFLEKFFQEYHQTVKQFGPRSGPTFVGHDLGPNCLQLLFRLSADNTSKERLKVGVVFGKVNCFSYLFSGAL